MTHPKVFASEQSPPWRVEWKGAGCWLTPPASMDLNEACTLADAAGLNVHMTKTTISGVRKVFVTQ